MSPRPLDLVDLFEQPARVRLMDAHDMQRGRLRDLWSDDETPRPRPPALQLPPPKRKAAPPKPTPRERT